VSIDLIELNERIQNSNDNVDSISGLEIVLEALVGKFIDLYGKNMLLSAAYQIGAAPAHKISQRLLAARGEELYADPVEAMADLFSETKGFFHVEVADIQEKNGEIVVSMKNHCFLRSVIVKRPGLEMGGPLCRINKGYLETAIKDLTGKKVELKRTGDDNDACMCIETLRITV
jgi:predicted hydrocarbon binding protein